MLDGAGPPQPVKKMAAERVEWQPTQENARGGRRNAGTRPLAVTSLLMAYFAVDGSSRVAPGADAFSATPGPGFRSLRK